MTIRFASIMFVLIVLAAGCASSAGPEFLIISANEYDDSFDAALDHLRSNDFTPVHVDRRAGIIETGSRQAATFLEPWDRENSSLAQATENTFSDQRRRVRIEFLPGRRTVPNPPTERELVSNDPAAFTSPLGDLTTHEGDIHIYTTVIVERRYRPGIRRSTWARQLTTQTTDPEDDLSRQREFWTPVHRDTAAERRLLARIEEQAHVREDRSEQMH